MTTSVKGQSQRPVQRWASVKVKPAVVALEEDSNGSNLSHAAELDDSGREGQAHRPQPEVTLRRTNPFLPEAFENGTFNPVHQGKSLVI